MKRRTVFGLVFGLVVGMLALALVLCVGRVDNRPYFRENYYTETKVLLHALVATNTLAEGELAAGFGRVILTPLLNAKSEHAAQGHFYSLPLAGYGGRRGRPAQGVHDDLEVKAIALRVLDRLIIFAGADALIIPREVADLVSQSLEGNPGLRREQIFLGATHTHSGMGGWGEGLVAEQFAGGFNPGVQTWFADRITAAIRLAVEDLKPASIGFSFFRAPEFVRNRLVGELGKVDPEFSFTVVKQAEGIMAVIGSYSAHATVLSDDFMEFSGDYPGFWQRAVEEATGGMAMFLAGAVGSHSPQPPARGIVGAQAMGHALAQSLLGHLPQVGLTNRVILGALGLPVQLPPLNVRVCDGLRLRPWLAKLVLPVHADAYLQAFRVGNTTWISTPCDFSGELALVLKEAMQARGRSAVITSFNGDYIGYVIPDRYYHLNRYESRIMSFFGPNTTDYLEELIRAITLDLAGI